MTALDTFLDLCADEIERRAALADEPVLSAGAAAFRSALASAAPVDAELTTIGAARYLAEAAPAPLLEPLAAAAGEILWVPTPRAPDDGGAQVGLGLIDAVRDFGEVMVGLVMLGPDGIYPEHSHEPQEIYLPIVGDGRWRYGGSDMYRPLGPESLIYNHPNDRHAIDANGAPLSALFVLWP